MGRFVSPSDLTAYLACPHLTTLSLEVVLGRRHRPRGREALADLVSDDVDCRTVEQLRLANALCLFVEQARRVAAWQ